MIVLLPRRADRRCWIGSGIPLIASIRKRAMERSVPTCDLAPLPHPPRRPCSACFGVLPAQKFLAPEPLLEYDQSHVALTTWATCRSCFAALWGDRSQQWRATLPPAGVSKW